MLDKGSLVPTGFGRVRTKRVPYTSIERVWETRLPFAVVLSVAAKEAKFEVVSTMLPDANSYIDIGYWKVLVSAGPVNPSLINAAETGKVKYRAGLGTQLGQGKNLCGGQVLGKSGH